MIQFFRKNGWQLNPDDKKLNNIIKAILRNEGNCPCQRNGSFKCPCEEYKNNTSNSRVVIDYIAGMTDEFLLREYQEIENNLTKHY